MAAPEDLTFPFWLVVSNDDSVVVIVDQFEYFLGFSSKELADRYLAESDDKTLGMRPMTQHDLEALAADHDAVEGLAWDWLPPSQSLNYFPLSDFRLQGNKSSSPGLHFG